MILSTLVTSQLHFEMYAVLHGHPVVILLQLSTHIVRARAVSYNRESLFPLIMILRLILHCNICMFIMPSLFFDR